MNSGWDSSNEVKLQSHWPPKCLQFENPLLGKTLKCKMLMWWIPQKGKPWRLRWACNSQKWWCHGDYLSWFTINHQSYVWFRFPLEMMNYPIDLWFFAPCGSSDLWAKGLSTKGTLGARKKRPLVACHFVCGRCPHHCSCFEIYHLLSTFVYTMNTILCLSYTMYNNVHNY